MNCTQLVLRHIDSSPERKALWHPSYGSTSFADLAKIASQTQQMAKTTGLKAGDRVLLMAGLGPELYGTITGLLAAGISVVLVEPWMPIARLNYAIGNIQPVAFLASKIGQLWGLRVPAVRRIPRWVSLQELRRQARKELEVQSLQADDPAIISFTSGTTGHPKGVLRTHGYLQEQHRILTASFGLQDLQGPDLCIFANFALVNLASGRTSLLVPPDWQPQHLKKIAQLPADLQAQTLTTGPAFLQELQKIGLPKSLQHIHVGGALIDIPIFEEGFRQLPAAHWSLVYGSTEAEPVAICDARESTERSRARGYYQALYLGRPVSSIRFQEREGSLWVAGPHVCPSYIGNEEDNRKHKFLDQSGIIWHNMGDRIGIDAGQFWYQGRAHQNHSDFILEQDIYRLLNASSGFVGTAKSQTKTLFWQGVPPNAEQMKTFPEIKLIVPISIVRDRRHRARIDRDMSLKPRRLSVGTWTTFTKERLPLAVYSLLSAGIALSGPLLAGLSLKWGSFLSSYIAIMVFLILLRLMDEVKDYHKDLLANPSRPLPRGLVTTEQIKPVIRSGLTFMACYAVTVGFFANITTGLLYAVLVLHIWLMYREFFIGSWLESRPLLYAISHQLSLLWLCTFPIAMRSPEAVTEPASWLFAIMIIGAFFSYEVSRKLDPNAHPILKTYRGVYGLRGAWLLVVIFNLIAALSARQLNILEWVGPLQLLTVASFLLVAKGKHQIGELAASLSLLWHLWLIPIESLIFSIWSH